MRSSNPKRKSQGHHRNTANPFAVLAQISKACGSTAADPKLELVASKLDKVNELEAMGFKVVASALPMDKTGRGRPRSRTPEHYATLIDAVTAAIVWNFGGGCKATISAVAKDFPDMTIGTLERHLRWALRGTKWRNWKAFRRDVLSSRGEIPVRKTAKSLH
jgi:hypothetical protein